MTLPESAVETIVAVSTPPGRGGIGIVRLSGPGALVLVERLVRLGRPLEHGRVRRGRVLDSALELMPDGCAMAGGTGGDVRVIDEAVVTAFFAPRSYTGEDVVEIAAHGAPVVLEAVVRGALDWGGRLGLAVRLARAGEFTQRAFFAGRIDLTQAEAVHDLIAAQTLEQARVAAQQMGGAISRRVGPAKEELLHLIALLEAGMDFAAELDDVAIVPPKQIAAAIAGVRAPLEVLAGSFRRGQLMLNGAAIALIGPPNVGKSSLFNRLLERERAIVTPLPGTTRDTVEESVALGGVPVRLIDTAGLRGAEVGVDAAELQGIARSREALADADLVLVVHDAAEELTAGELEVVAALRGDGLGRPHLVVYNKIDLPGVVVREAGVIGTSALTGEGLEALRVAILAELGAAGSGAEIGSLNNLRQQEAVSETLAALAVATEANEAGLPHEMLLVDLHSALRALDSLTGVTTTEDILGRIFAAFCIGK